MTLSRILRPAGGRLSTCALWPWVSYGCFRGTLAGASVINKFQGSELTVYLMLMNLMQVCTWAKYCVRGSRNCSDILFGKNNVQ